MKIKTIYFLAKIYNKSFNNRVSEFIYLSILSFIFLLLLSPFIKEFDKDSFFFLIFCISILSITTHRLSDVIIYSSLTKTLSMNLSKIDMYSEYNYDIAEDKDIIANKFKESFINAIIGCKYKKINMNTHKWVIHNVINDDRVKELFDIDIKKKGKTNISLEALLLANGKTNKTSFERDAYRVKLKRRG